MGRNLCRAADISCLTVLFLDTLFFNTLFFNTGKFTRRDGTAKPRDRVRHGKMRCLR